MSSSSLTEAYADRLKTAGDRGWKKWIDVQAPYRWNLRRLKLGRTLDVGCGVGRNLLHLPKGSVGVDPNLSCVAGARERGCTAFSPAEFLATRPAAGSFDSLLCAHVLEHLPFSEAVALVLKYLPHLKAGGRLVLITPQESGYRSDATHIEFTDDKKLAEVARICGLEPVRQYSFPFPRIVGHFFPHNEFVLVAEKPARAPHG